MANPVRLGYQLDRLEQLQAGTTVAHKDERGVLPDKMLIHLVDNAGPKTRSESGGEVGGGSITRSQIAETGSDLCQYRFPPRISRRREAAKTGGLMNRVCISYSFYPDPFVILYVATAPIIDIPAKTIDATWKKRNQLRASSSKIITTLLYYLINTARAVNVNNK